MTRRDSTRILLSILASCIQENRITQVMAGNGAKLSHTQAMIYIKRLLHAGFLQKNKTKYWTTKDGEIFLEFLRRLWK